MPSLGTLGGRIVLASVGVALLAVVLAGAIGGAALRFEFDRYSRQQQDDRADQIVASLASAYERRGRWDAADLEPAQQLALTAGATLAVQDERGTVVLAALEMPVGIGAFGGMGSGMAEAMRRMHGSGAIALAPARREPIAAGGRTVGTAIIAFPATDLPAERDVRDALARAQLTAAGIAALAALLVGIVIAGRIARPVAALASATESLRRGERGARVRDLPSDELGDLGRSFNEMAGSLEREDELRRRVVADVAHELRTPLTSIQGHLEALRDGVLPPDAATLALVHDEAERLGRLVADLETLVRAEGAGFALDRRQVDVADIVRNVSAELTDRFEKKDVRLELDLSPARAVADEDRVAQIARNLVSNALKFTPGGGTVRVSTRGQDGRALVEVSDTGIGMTDDEASHAFDRFWRAPGASSTPGSGIGLTIARELALAHGGDVTVQSEPGRGSTFRVTLPAA